MSVEIQLADGQAARCPNDNSGNFTLSAKVSEAERHIILSAMYVPSRAIVPDAPFVVASGTSNYSF